ncbi:c-type cytochrome [Chitinilyticum litopenaei]|uniref:c-type cytochrome n=1 Tax=Chitinilyticum litopenaei TaxID=1121276 RepID=UPI000411E4D8|nr:c-type cytochrome [Chitinilyticum litopenaei]
MTLPTTLLTCCGLLLAAAGASAANPVNPAELAKAKACMACHAPDKKLVGPSYRDVAAKYKNDKGAVAKLATKIQKGGSGAWGSLAMPANAVTDAEAKALAQWVLSTK